jgi:4,4'-diaponeurosporenoate glycosyltransferase
MIALTLLCLLGLAAGFLLLVRVPLCDSREEAPVEPCSIIIPARNEAHTLPRLLESIRRPETHTFELLVVDDHSSDDTGVIAAQNGARILAAPPLQAGWTGKTSACVAGAKVAQQDRLLFLDADTWFETDGLTRLVQTFVLLTPGPVALSVIPYHVIREPYEEFSLFFNLMMIFGAGGFGILRRGRLFGQSLLLSRALYTCSGTHQAVRGEILENVALSQRIVAAGGRCVCLGGRDVLQMRMFPDGLRQLCEGWTKAFASGAAASDGTLLTISILWLTALCSGFLRLLFASGTERAFAAVVYLSFVLQIVWFARQVGSFRWYTCVLYPIPLLFFFVVFARSLKRRVFGQGVTWKGRLI